MNRTFRSNCIACTLGSFSPGKTIVLPILSFSTDERSALLSLEKVVNS